MSDNANNTEKYPRPPLLTSRNRRRVLPKR